MLIYAGDITNFNCFLLNCEFVMQRPWNEDDMLADMIKQHYSSMYSYGMHFVNNESLVKDCIQDVFVNLWKNRRSGEEITYMKAYLLTALRRRLIRVMAQHKVRHLAAEKQMNEDAFHAEFTVEDLIIDKQLKEEQAQKLRHILSQLPSRQKEVIYLVYYQQMEMAEVAKLMGIQVQSVYNLLHETLRKIKNFWADTN
jgi:RNA polymerase sigma factor (sigma-70 family)